MITQAACPSCGAANRIAPGRPPEAAKCGKCGAALALAKPVEVDDAAFNLHLERTKGPVLVDIWAPWCGPCRAMAPQFEAAAGQLAGEARLLKINADTNAAPASLKVAGIPALILFENGREIARTGGAMPAAALSEWVRNRVVEASAAAARRGVA
ncbi:MAG: redoxin domain-containing protein [Alphaproteobacteria bacterium]|nr:redoxin domain-containing protein [Alphaproteobacteria bacterium]